MSVMERVQYRDEVTGAPSPMIWGDPELVKCEDPRFGFHRFDDFEAFPNVAASVTNTARGDYMAHTSSSTATIAAANEAGGVIGFTSSANSQAAVLALAAAIVNMPGADADAASAGKKFALEAKLKTTTIADTKHEFFFGLLNNTALGDAVPITDTIGTLASQLLIGFHRAEDAGEMIDTAYYTASSPTVVKAEAITDSEQTTANGKTIPAFAINTFIKLGMLYVPNQVNVNGDNLGFYADGILLDDGLTNQEIYDLTALAAGFLRMVFGIRTAASSAGTTYLDWWKFAMVR